MDVDDDVTDDASVSLLLLLLLRDEREDVELTIVAERWLRETQRTARRCCRARAAVVVLHYLCLSVIRVQ